ncbi:multiprotein bridging factor aMBF1 [Candidatus Marsarchaeota archaeon]|jgi:putative transcription factor|nr:multiprotein bridging factor aMBF1 [Candidatus Marsarchaeota archaeon]MCL5092075.1 multiprotein bridging factor aMBF1 [Candidatus Marsarchaeota archaeon]
MEDCELCGRQAETVYVALVEDVELRVCPKCAKGKKIISSEGHSMSRKGATAVKTEKGEEPELIEDYGHVIKEARERLKMPLKVLAEMINEKETFLNRVEAQRTTPPEALVRKLEKTLSIKLIEQEKAGESGRTGAKGEKATLGDFIGTK